MVQKILTNKFKSHGQTEIKINRKLNIHFTIKEVISIKIKINLDHSDLEDNNNSKFDRRLNYRILLMIRHFNLKL
ncbi:hypothetical protein BpHYR1_020230 [Brachionus plicatilis]|uniref:Uncharacterized protein n=1 Tax=Brachionus plicatilis TaxID=10195 RepID=A0A3M7RHU8_BRAPC|nr:hypothetical protein BpHYR1_020230 [Brachionus plicatilis]